MNRVTLLTPVSNTPFPIYPPVGTRAALLQYATDCFAWRQKDIEELQQLKQKWQGFTDNPLANARLEIINKILDEKEV